MRSTVGSLFHLPLVIGVEPDGLLERLCHEGLTVLAADGYGGTDLDELQEESAARRLRTGDGRGTSTGGRTTTSDAATLELEPHAVPVRLENPTVWLFGNEAQGLPAGLTAGAHARVAVPIYGRAESLNVGTAATVCLYASARAQRRP